MIFFFKFFTDASASAPHIHTRLVRTIHSEMWKKYRNSFLIICVVFSSFLRIHTCSKQTAGKESGCFKKKMKDQEGYKNVKKRINGCSNDVHVQYGICDVCAG